MMPHEPSPTLVRDTVYAAVMLDLNGIPGLAALMGGRLHGEQPYIDHRYSRGYQPERRRKNQRDRGHAHFVLFATFIMLSLIGL